MQKSIISFDPHISIFSPFHHCFLLLLVDPLELLETVTTQSNNFISFYSFLTLSSLLSAAVGGSSIYTSEDCDGDTKVIVYFIHLCSDIYHIHLSIIEFCYSVFLNSLFVNTVTII